MEEHRQFNLNCTTFTGEQLKAINLTRSITAMVCAVIVALIFFFLLCNKVYSKTFGKLYIYVIIATIFSESIQACGIEHQFHYEGQEEVCFYLAFITHWTSVIIFIYAFETILYLSYHVIVRIWGDHCYKVPESKCCQILLHTLFILLPIFLSLPIAVVPYMNNNYGVAGPWCWIRSVDENCTGVGLTDQMIYFCLYWAVGAIGVTINCVFSVMYCKLAENFKKARKLLKLTLLLLAFQLVYILIVTLQLAVRLYTALTGRQQYIQLWYVHAFVIPTGQLLFPLSYFISFNPVKEILRQSIMKARHLCKNWCERRICVVHNEEEIQNGDIEPSTNIPESSRVSPLSHTYFEVPYTNAFTNISENSEHSQALHRRIADSSKQAQNYGTFNT